MLYNLLVPLADDFQLFNLFRYLTFRTGAAVITALVISFLVGPALIAWLRKKQRHGQPIRADGPESHLQTKQGTPTMGGMLILLALSISTLLWADLGNPYVWIVFFVTISFGAIGFYDDFLKLTRRSHHGLSGKGKLLAQFVVGGVATYAVVHFSPPELANQLALPFVKDVLLNLGLFFIVFGTFVMVGASNAVNLTDGLDGLAIVPVMIAASCFAFIAYLVGNVVYANYLQIHYVQGTGELAVFCGDRKSVV